MSKRLRVELNLNGITQLKATPGVMDYLADLAAPRTPDGCEAKPWYGRWTSTIVIHPVSAKAKRENLESNTLLKGLGR